MWIESTGLGNGKGHLSFNKSVTLVALITFVYCVVTRREPSPWLLSFGVVVIGAGFGLKGFVASLTQRTMQKALDTQSPDGGMA